MKLRSTLNPEEQANLVEEPTLFRKDPNQLELLCSFCGEIYFVDDVTFQQARSAMEEGGDNPFCCGDCETEYEELSQ